MTKLEVAATKFAEKNYSWLKDALPTLAAMKSFKAGAEWRNNNLWHDAQGDDLPEIDREVIVLCNNGQIAFEHRPNPDGEVWKHPDGTLEHVHFETYGKGGWNIPDVRWCLDCILPNLEEQQ